MSVVDDSYDEELEEGSLLSHLLELRNRLMRAFGAVLVVFVCLVPFAQKLFTYVSLPLQKALPVGNTMIATDPASTVFTPFKLAFFIAIFIAMPVILYQAWAFVAPGLYRKEKRFAIPLLGSSITLFYLGVAFAYFIVFPLVFKFVVAFAPEGVENMTDIASYLTFALTLFLAFGLAFEVPVATVLLVWAGLTTPKKLKGIRPYVFLGCFVVGMFLTPPDMLSQTMLAIPVYILFELGIIGSQILLRDKLAARAAEEAADAADENDA
ncbi:MAG: twin-arginine translocase subunit TatC [Pseudomonadota bacterium]